MSFCTSVLGAGDSVVAGPAKSENVISALRKHFVWRKQGQFVTGKIENPTRHILLRNRGGRKISQISSFSNLPLRSEEPFSGLGDE